MMGAGRGRTVHGERHTAHGARLTAYGSRLTAQEAPFNYRIDVSSRAAGVMAEGKSSKAKNAR